MALEACTIRAVQATSPNLLVDHSGGGCGDGMDLEPTQWGTILMEGLTIPW